MQCKNDQIWFDMSEKSNTCRKKTARIHGPWHHLHMLNLHQDTKYQMAKFLELASVEITAKQVDKVPILAQHLAKGTRVFVALLDANDLDAQVIAVSHLQQAGFQAVPHLPARFVRDEEDLKRRIATFAKSGATQLLVLGGGAAQPIGKFDAAIQLMETGVLEAQGISRIGIAGHPEGNPDISKVHGEAALMQALKQKQAWLKEKNIGGFIATQFLFDAEPLAFWAKGLREQGIDLPLHVGIPGPASIKTLVRYAALCGVGHSARFIRKQALNITKLLTVSEPTEFVEQLTKLHFEKPDLKIAGPHMYPFGGFDKLFAWWDQVKD